jgi:hypothetical protein
MVALKYGLSAVFALVAGWLVTLVLGSEPAGVPTVVAVDAPHKVLPASLLVQRTAAAPAPLAAAPALAPAPAAGTPTPAPDPDKAYRDWSSKVAVLPQDLGQMGPSLKLALDDARNKDMAFCFREVEGAPGPHTIRSSNLVLFLETREGAVDVVEARIAHAGTLPPAVVDCAVEVLRGMAVKVFFVVPGQRYSYLYEIEA